MIDMIQLNIRQINTTNHHVDCEIFKILFTKSIFFKPHDRHRYATPRFTKDG